MQIPRVRCGDRVLDTKYIPERLKASLSLSFARVVTPKASYQFDSTCENDEPLRGGSFSPTPHCTFQEGCCVRLSVQDE